LHAATIMGMDLQASSWSYSNNGLQRRHSPKLPCWAKFCAPSPSGLPSTAMSQAYTPTGQPQYPQGAYQGQGQPPPGAYMTPPPQGYPGPDQSYPQDKGPPPQGYQQQPQAVAPMVAAGGGNRNALNLPVGNEGRPWSFDFFDCFGDAGTCLLAYFVPCVVYGQNKKRLEHLTTHGTPDPQSGELFSGDCFLHCCLTGCAGCGWALQMGVRGSIRSRYHIQGGSCGDCMSALCCTPCELTQESRELELEERSLGRPGPGMVGK